MSKATACPPSVVADTIMRTIELGVTITDAAVDEEVTTIFCAPVARDPRCPDCGREGRYRDTITRPLTDLPVAGYLLVLRVAVPRYRCVTLDCGRVVFCQDLGKLAAPRSATTRWCARYVLRRLMIDTHHGLGDRRRARRLLAHRQLDRDACHRGVGRRGRAADPTCARPGPRTGRSRPRTSRSIPCPRRKRFTTHGVKGLSDLPRSRRRAEDYGVGPDDVVASGHRQIFGRFVVCRPGRVLCEGFRIAGFGDVAKAHLGACGLRCGGDPVRHCRAVPGGRLIDDRQLGRNSIAARAGSSVRAARRELLCYRPLDWVVIMGPLPGDVSAALR